MSKFSVLFFSVVLVLSVKEWRDWLELGQGQLFLLPLHFFVGPGGLVSNSWEKLAFIFSTITTNRVVHYPKPYCNSHSLKYRLNV